MEESSPYLPLLIALGATVIGVIFFIVGRSLRREEREITGDLLTARAIILKKFRKEGAGTWGGIENYFVVARFQDAEGGAHEVEVQVLSRAWRLLREGGITSLNYPPARPEQARFGSRFAYRCRRGLGMVLMIGGVAEAIFFGFFCVREFFRNSH